MSKLFIFVINFYQIAISPYLGKNCRFYPSCSNYSKQAFIKYNFLKALYLTIKRLLKCNPFNKGYYDPLT